MTQPTAYSYLRFSSPAQAKGDSRRRQITRAIDYAAEHGLHLDDSLRDEGVSAFRSRHLDEGGALARFLTKIDGGEVAPGSFLLMESLDRLSRDKQMRAVHLLTGICTRGVTIVTLMDRREYGADSSMEDLLYAVMVLSRGHEESLTKSQRGRDFLDKAKKVAREERRPWTRSAPFWLDVVDGRFVQKGDGYTTVRTIFDWKIEGLGNAAIARRLNDARTPPPRPRKKSLEAGVGAVWHADTVANVLSSRAVFGEYQPHRNTGVGNRREPDGEPISDFYPEVVTRAKFEQAQAVIAARRNPAARPRTAEFTNLLVGLATCERCGGTAGYWQQTRPKKAHLKPLGVIRCNRFNAGACDNRTRLRYPALEAELLAYVGGLKLPGRESTVAADLATRRAELTDVRTAQGRLFDLVQMAGGSDSAAERLRDLDAREKALRAEIGQLERAHTVERNAPAPADWRAAMTALIADMEAADDGERYAIRAQINARLAQVVRGGFTLGDGSLSAHLEPERADGRKPLYWGKDGGLIRWQISADAPSFDQMGVAAVS